MSSASSSNRWYRNSAITAGEICLFAALYFVGGRLGLALTDYHDNVTLVWPPTGLSLAALILFGLRLWPGIPIGVLLLSAATDTSWLTSLGIATGNTLEAVVGALLLVRVARFRPTLERPRDVLAFLLLGAIGCTVVSASIGVSTLWLSGSLEPSEAGMLWLVWWAGDAAGAVILSPTLFMLLHGTPPWGGLLRRAEWWLMLAAIFGSSLLAFGGVASGPWAGVASFGPFPLLVWAGTRLGPRAAVTASFWIMVTATLGTANGLGPFMQDETQHSTMLLWAYGISLGGIALTLAAVIGQRDLAEQLHRSEETARRRIEQEQLLLLERERITREMHDGLGGQLVSTIAMVERGRASREEIAEFLRQALDDMRIAIDSLDPNTTDLRVSLGKLRSMLEPLLRRNEIRLAWEIADEPVLDGFAADKSLHLLRIIQEAVTNAVRHADAGCIEIRISSADGSPSALYLEIRDDGVGLPTGSNLGGRGIRNMETRAADLGAELRISATNPGTRVELTVPLER